jgi:hypothetical protein
MSSAKSPERWLLPPAFFDLSVTWGHTWVIAKQALTYAPPFAAFVSAARCVQNREMMN